MREVPEGSQLTLWKHLTRAAVNSVEAAQELDRAPLLPMAAQHVWESWNVMDGQRQHSGSGLLPLTEMHVRAFCDNREMAFDRVELDIFWAIERTFLRHAAKQAPPDGEAEDDASALADDT